MNTAKRKCSVCGNTKWIPFLKFDSKNSMTSDQRAVNLQLDKSQCFHCGVVANTTSFDKKALKILYEEDYSLNTTGGEEHYFFTSLGPVARSQVYTEWLKPHFPPDFNSVLEIGCGEGNVLKRLSEAYPGKSFQGLEASKRACELSHKKGLKVKQIFLTNKKDDIPSSDIIYHIGVVEHLEDPESFLLKCRDSLNGNGRMILSLPIQDHANYDVYFVDHIWHFSVEHVKSILRRTGWKVLFQESNHPVNHGFGLFVCEKSDFRNIPPAASEGRYIESSRDLWLQHIQSLPLKLKNVENIAVFGTNEIFSLFYNYSGFGNSKILCCIDENKSKIGTAINGIKIEPPEWLEKNPVDAVLLAVNPKYHEIIAHKLEKFGVKIIKGVI